MKEQASKQDSPNGSMQDSSTSNIALKQKQFNTAMELYNSRKVYKSFDILVSVSNIALQLCSLYLVMSFSIGFIWQMVALILAFLIADFVNGLVHLYMDSNDAYDSIAGPLIANFHLHHKSPRDVKDSLIGVYFIN